MQYRQDSLILFCLCTRSPANTASACHERQLNRIYPALHIFFPVLPTSRMKTVPEYKVQSHLRIIAYYQRSCNRRRLFKKYNWTVTGKGNLFNNQLFLGTSTQRHTALTSLSCPVSSFQINYVEFRDDTLGYC